MSVHDDVSWQGTHATLYTLRPPLRWPHPPWLQAHIIGPGFFEDHKFCIFCGWSVRSVIQYGRCRKCTAVDFMFITQCGRLTLESILTVFLKVVIVENSNDPCTVAAWLRLQKLVKQSVIYRRWSLCLFTLCVASWRDVLHSYGVFLQFKVVVVCMLPFRNLWHRNMATGSWLV